jgi:hypothetical protein
MDANGDANAGSGRPVRRKPTRLNAIIVYGTVVGAYVLALAFLALVLWLAGRAGLGLYRLATS